MLKSTICLLTISLCPTLAVAQETTPSAQSASSTIIYEPDEAGRYPESFGYDPSENRYIVSSSSGQLGAVDANGDYTIFASDADANPATGGAGVTVDTKRGRVYSVQNDFVGANDSTLAIHDLDGTLVKLIDLDELHEGARTFANVIRIDEQGMAYITDSWSPVIYAIDTSLNASVFLTDDVFATSASHDANDNALFGAAGMALRDNKLFITHSEGVKLFSIDLADPGKTIVQIPYDASDVPPLVDGIVFLSESELALITNWSRTVRTLETADDWQSATLSDKSWTAPGGMPTEGALVDGQLRVINSHFDAMIGSFSGGPHREQFEIHTVKF